MPTPRIAIGVDVVEIVRVERLLERHPNAADKLFSPAERAYCEARRRAGEHFAARFAAKEAVLKALGCGLRDGVRWRDVEVETAENGRPSVLLHGRAESLATELGVAQLELSLSHAAGVAVAQAAAVLEPSGE